MTLLSIRMGYAPSTIRGWLREGKYPGERLGGRWIVPAKDLKVWQQAFGLEL